MIVHIKKNHVAAEEAALTLVWHEPYTELATGDTNSRSARVLFVHNYRTLAGVLVTSLGFQVTNPGKELSVRVGGLILGCFGGESMAAHIKLDGKLIIRSALSMRHLHDSLSCIC